MQKNWSETDAGKALNLCGAGQAARQFGRATNKLVLLTGATGYIGGRLLPLLVEDAWRVRCLARQLEKLLPRVPVGVEVVCGDLLKPESLGSAMADVEAGFYLVHSMGGTGNFRWQDRQAAQNESWVGAAVRF